MNLGPQSFKTALPYLFVILVELILSFVWGGSVFGIYATISSAHNVDPLLDNLDGSVLGIISESTAMDILHLLKFEHSK